MKIYGDLRSGNCLKVKYLCDLLGIAYEWQPVDILSGESRSPSFLALNPAGQIPLVDFGDGYLLAQSNAILQYLAKDTPLHPKRRFLRSKGNEWLFWEQYSHEPYIAVCRFQMLYQGWPASQRDDWRVARGKSALTVMQQHLSRNDWFAAGQFTIADIALLAYTRLAHEGGFAVSEFDAIQDWVARAEAELGLAE